MMYDGRRVATITSKKGVVEKVVVVEEEAAVAIVKVEDISRGVTGATDGSRAEAVEVATPLDKEEELIGT
jgi:hypothetical protein